jgi:hypothetical protein
MNSDLIPSSQASNSPASEQTPIETASEEIKANRQQPIPPPSEPMQYRAIGLVSGHYQASDEQLTQGTLVTTDGTQLNAVLLGRIISLVRNHLDLTQAHLWVVYPRTGQRTDELHLQIVGVWEPEKLSKSLATQRPQPEEEPASSENLEVSSPEIEDGYFSIRGEVVYQSAANSQLVVKIKQSARKDSEKPKHFKLKLQGVLKTKAVGQFWDLEVKRQMDNLVVQQGKAIADLPKPPKPKRKPQPRQAGQFSGRSNFDTPRPVRKADGSSTTASRPLPKAPTPKPQKRPKPPQ